MIWGTVHDLRRSCFSQLLSRTRTYHFPICNSIQSFSQPLYQSYLNSASGLYSLLLSIRPLIPFAVSWLTENIFLTKKDSNTFLFISLLTSMCSFCFGASLCFGVFLTFPTSNLLNSGPYSLPSTSCILQP